jgi:hypothetical protein
MDPELEAFIPLFPPAELSDPVTTPKDLAELAAPAPAPDTTVNADPAGPAQHGDPTDRLRRVAYAGLLRASTIDELRTWQLSRERLADAGMGLLILTGLAMPKQSWSFTDGWILVAIGVLASRSPQPARRRPYLEKPMVWRERSWLDVLALDPRDTDIVRAKDIDHSRERRATRGSYVQHDQSINTINRLIHDVLRLVSVVRGPRLARQPRREPEACIEPRKSRRERSSTFFPGTARSRRRSSRGHRSGPAQAREA